MTIRHFNLNIVHPSWQSCLQQALEQIDPSYLNELYSNQDWLPGHEKIFNAFTLPIDQVNYVLFGESPYPRAGSANGFAFWDAAVTDIWSETGLSKQVNRATSLRNLIKMFLVAEGALAPTQTAQPDIMQVDKKHLVKTNSELFNNFLRHGFLLLNATPVLHQESVRKDAIAWQPFIKHVLNHLFQKNPHVELVLFGNIANTIDKLVDHFDIKRLYAEHPYNHSFINNPEVLTFFRPLQLLSL
jgi:uracil-DNA glycosylase